MSAPRGYASWLIAIVALTSLLAFALNTRVNPWRVTPFPWSDEALDDYRDVSSQIRTAKAGMVRSAPGLGAAFFGSSRVANALDPADPRWQRDEVLNLGCSGGFLYESIAMCRYAMEQQPLELAILAIDPGDLGSELDTRPMGDFHASPLAGGSNPDRELRYLIGISTVEESLQTLKRASREQLPQYNPLGLRVRSRKAPGRPQIDFIRDQISGEAEFGLFSTGRGDSPVNADKAARLEELLREARRREVRMLVYLHPTHALRHLRADDLADPPVLFENERRALLGIVTRANDDRSLDGPPVELWDFLDAHPLNGDPLPRGEATMAHWTDLDHYTPEIGGLIQARMLGWPVAVAGGEDYGVRLTADSLEPWFRRIRESVRRYLAGPGARDIQWKEELIERSGPDR